MAPDERADYDGHTHTHAHTRQKKTTFIALQKRKIYIEH